MFTRYFCTSHHLISVHHPCANSFYVCRPGWFLLSGQVALCAMIHTLQMYCTVLYIHAFYLVRLCLYISEGWSCHIFHISAKAFCFSLYSIGIICIYHRTKSFGRCLHPHCKDANKQLALKYPSSLSPIRTCNRRPVTQYSLF
jgi:hypothetical protein